MTDKYISMRQFAKMAGVSPATVSHVFSAPQTVAEATVKRVLILAENVGFTPNLVAKAAFGESTKSVGVILSSFSDKYFGTIANAVQRELIKADYLPIIIEGSTSPEESITRLLKHKVDGLIIGCSDEQLNVPSICRKQMVRLPIVNLEQMRPGVWGDTVLNDDYDGGFQVGRHLTGLGHRRFGICSYGGERSNCVARIKGFQDAIRSEGGILNDDYCAHLGFGPEISGRVILQEKLCSILKRTDLPTAFFAASDFLALEFYQAAKLCGKRIPDDFSVVGFGDLQFAPYVSPALTTVQQDPATIGTNAVAFLLNRLKHPQYPTQEIRVPVKLLVRESTAKENHRK